MNFFAPPTIRRVRAEWTINGDFLHLAETGVARYAREVVAALDALKACGHPALDGIALTLVARRPVRRPPALRAIAVVEVDAPRLPQGFVQLALPRHVRGGLVSLCNLGPLAVRRQILCIHDVHPLVHPESFSRGFRAYSRTMLPALGRRVAHVTTVSRYSARELMRHGVAPAERISVTGNGHEHVAAALAEDPVPAAAMPRRAVVGIGRDLAYKNTALLLALAPRLDALGLDLVLPGAFDATRLLGGRPLPANVRLPGRLSDAALFRTVARAEAFLFPSRVEGFGLPAIEAMAVDCPLVVARAGSLPETCGDAAIALDPDDADGWIAAVERIASDAALRTALVAAGRERLPLYSWPAIALHYAQRMRALAEVFAS